jgi:hypothetical protein
VFGVGGDENDGRRLGQGTHRMGHRKAILPGHVDVQQDEIKAPATGRAQQRQSLGRVRGLGHGQALLRYRQGIPAVAQQGAQSASGQGLVVNDQDVHG